MNQREYLSRIRFTGNAEAKLEVLQRLQKLNLLTIPFENLDIHYGIRIELDLEKIFKKIIEGNRGGFCYELNGLYYELLTSIGFTTKRISARVYNPQKGYGHEYDHLAVIVTLHEQEYLTDVGYGEFAFAPLRLEMNKVQSDERGDYIIDQYDQDYFRVSKIETGETKPQYIFKNIKRQFREFEGMCNYHQTNSESHFTQKKLISIATRHGRITLTSDKLRITDGDHVEERLIRDEAEFEEELWRYFKIRVQKKS